MFWIIFVVYLVCLAGDFYNDSTADFNSLDQ